MTRWRPSETPWARDCCSFPISFSRNDSNRLPFSLSLKEFSSHIVLLRWGSEFDNLTSFFLNKTQITNARKSTYFSFGGNFNAYDPERNFNPLRWIYRVMRYFFIHNHAVVLATAYQHISLLQVSFQLSGDRQKLSWLWLEWGRNLATLSSRH